MCRYALSNLVQARSELRRALDDVEKACSLQAINGGAEISGIAEPHAARARAKANRAIRLLDAVALQTFQDEEEPK